MNQFIIQSTAGGLLVSLLLLLVVAWIAERNHFFKFPPPSPAVPVTFLQTIGAFLTYIIFAMLVVPIVVLFFAYLVTGEIQSIKFLPSIWLSWIQLISLFIIFFLIILYLFCIKKESRHFILWGEGERSRTRFLKSFGTGIIGWVVSYPFVLFIGLIAKVTALYFWGQSEVEQVAVKQLKMTVGHTALLVLMIFVIVVLVPFIEEVLFRGFLQNFLKRHLGRVWAIILAGIIFALAHFSLSQGVGNFQLIITLSVLSFFLGFIYERERTLWAPYALHVTFNAISIVMILIGLN